MATAPVKNAYRTEPGSRAVLEIEIAEDEVGRAMDRAFATLVQRVQVPGFRRGKAPRAVLERHVGTEALRARHVHLVSAGDAAARRGDFVLLNVKRAPQEMKRLQPGKELLVEVGGGLLPAEVEAAVEGARPGDEWTAQPAEAGGPVEV